MCEDLKVLALCEGRLQAHVEPLRVAGCSLHVESRSAWQMLRHYPQLAARARRERPQIILANAPAWHATIARRLASLAHAQTTLVIRGDLWAELNEMLKKRYAASPIRSVDVKIRRRLGASNIPSVDRLIAVSDYIRGLVIECTGVPEERVTTVHPAVDVEHFLPSDEDPARLRAEIGVSVPHLICAVTNFNFHRKIEGLSRFMPVLHELLSRRDDVAVALAGGGAYYDEFRERHARELAHDRMLLLGFFKPITKLYHASDALVHFTLLDGIPNTAAEANACGLPVVANDFPSMLECITNSVNGYLVPSEVDMEMTVSAIERLLDDSDLRVRMGQAGRERVITTRAPEVIGRQLAAILRAQVGA